jgi:hypothetical protein
MERLAQKTLIEYDTFDPVKISGEMFSYCN